ncbi:MAG: type II toxin-antitoxin system RelE family toxin [Candidatus Entotheonellia bacterium]
MTRFDKLTIILVIMEPKPPFTIIYAPITRSHLLAIEAKYYSLIRTTIKERLSSEPDIQTRNRKPLKRPVSFGATWELRFGPGNQFRVLYDIDRPRHVVAVLAIGIKRGSRLFIGGEEIRL